VDIPVPVPVVSTRARGLRTTQGRTALAITRRLVLPSAFLHSVGTLDRQHFAAQYSARVFPCQRFVTILADADA
jgi:hypothetical protein